MDGVVIDRAHESAAQAFEQYVLAYGEARNEIALLVDDADAGGDSVTRTLEADGRAVEPQFAIVRTIDASDNLDQRRFASAVLAEQRVDRAAAHRQRYVLKPGLAQPIDADRPEDQQTEHDLDEAGSNVKDHERLRYDRDDHDAEQCAEDADVSAAERGAADDGRGERQDQPVVANRGLAELQARDEHDAGERRENAGNRVRRNDRARNRNAGKLCCVRIAA